MKVGFTLGFRDSLEDKSKTNLVQIKGRFSVTSENVDLVKVCRAEYSLDTHLFKMIISDLNINVRISLYVQFLDGILK